MSEIASFYGFTVSMDGGFHGTPQVLIDYPEEGLKGHYDFDKGTFTDGDFPKSFLRVLQEWAADNRQALQSMWEKKQISVLPDWE